MELTFTVRGADGSEYGPASLDQLTQWIAEGRVAPEWDVRRSDMDYFAAANAFTELKDLFAPAAICVAAGPSSPPPLPLSLTLPIPAQAESENAGTLRVARPSPKPVSAAPAPFTGTPSVSAAAAEKANGVKSGGAWFFWIAVISLLNTFFGMAGASRRFVIGLGMTEVFDAIAAELGGAGRMIGLMLDFVAAGIFVLFGVFAIKGQRWAFIAGMIVFALDSLIFLVARDWVGIAFHAFVLFCLFKGFEACRKQYR